MALPRFGMVHGRFQPIHNDHLEYILEADACCSSLVVGITGADSSQIKFEASEPERSDPARNPFPYHLRARMIRDSLVEAGLPPSDLLIMPFPVHDPLLWSAYVPPNVVHYLRVFSPWGEAKVQRLRAAGHQVVDLADGRPKGISATEVRRRWHRGGDWRSLIPAAAAAILQEYGDQVACSP